MAVSECKLSIAGSLYPSWLAFILQAFKFIVKDPDSVFNFLASEVKEIGPDGQEVSKVVPALSEELKDSLEAMRKAEAAGYKDCSVKISVVAPPLYILTTQTLDVEQGISIVNIAIAACTEEIEHHGGRLPLKEAARTVSERDDKLFAKDMAKLSHDNEELTEDEDNEDEGMGDIDLENSGFLGKQSENAMSITVNSYLFFVLSMLPLTHQFTRYIKPVWIEVACYFSYFANLAMMSNVPIYWKC
ncbi:eukaryotic translation initiation factor 2 subunit 1 [Actinidia rufa]|uniref:Eukaryotic translation initiation factor 2 subunit 1 n=1 Tax=Actinidia rufa TaxID=165716 RepID=A0A7J0GE20_9ERIC|nr:eukaryotic translation initiation factor 2 subunit 1 [Actinidia rufa]